MGPEKKFETKVRKYLESQGAYVVKYFGCGFTQAGVPDLLCCYKGHFLALEIKSERGKPSELQIHNICKINEAGGTAMVLYPSDFEKLCSVLKNLQ